MKFENIEIFNFEGALRGMRNPKESWDRSDSCTAVNCGECGVIEREGFCKPKEHDCHKYAYYSVGAKDMKLAQALILAGPEHAKFLRQIFVSVDITAPLYWWKEFDTYKVGTTANSTSTMHKIASKPITIDLFEIGDYRNELSLIDDQILGVRIDCFIDDLEQLRQLYLMNLEKAKEFETDSSEHAEYMHLAKSYWKELIRWLPEGWLQTRTVTMSYANLRNMYFQRRNHKQKEWSIDFMNFIDSLPLVEDFIKIERNDVVHAK